MWFRKCKKDPECSECCREGDSKNACLKNGQDCNIRPDVELIDTFSQERCSKRPLNKKSDCPHCNSPLVKKSFKNRTYELRRWSVWLIAFAMLVGIIAPYSVHVLGVGQEPNAQTSLEIWSQFVSLILGVVATILSIVSMIMSFRNYDDALVLQEKNNNTFHEIAMVASKLEGVAQTISGVSNNLQKVDTAIIELQKLTSNMSDKVGHLTNTLGNSSSPQNTEENSNNSSGEQSIDVNSKIPIDEK